MPRRSAALLVYRRGGEDGLEVLIGHMGGPFWARKQARAWSIPKGEYDGAEAPLAAARREFEEEIGSACPRRARGGPGRAAPAGREGHRDVRGRRRPGPVRLPEQHVHDGVAPRIRAGQGVPRAGPRRVDEPRAGPRRCWSRARSRSWARCARTWGPDREALIRGGRCSAPPARTGRPPGPADSTGAASPAGRRCSPGWFTSNQTRPRMCWLCTPLNRSWTLANWLASAGLTAVSDRRIGLPVMACTWLMVDPNTLGERVPPRDVVAVDTDPGHIVGPRPPGADRLGSRRSCALTVQSQVTLSAPSARNTVTMCRQAATKVAAGVCRIAPRVPGAVHLVPEADHHRVTEVADTVGVRLQVGVL